MKDLLETISYAIAITGGVAAGSIYLFRLYKGRNENMDNKMSGAWTNEGDVSKLPTHFMGVDLVVQEKEVSGTLSSRNLESESEWHNLNLNGKRNGKEAKLEITHVRHGKVISLGQVELKLDKRSLSWNLIDGTADFFPQKTTLWKVD